MVKVSRFGGIVYKNFYLDYGGGKFYNKSMLTVVNYTNAVNLLTSQEKFHICLGLERVAAVLELMGSPQDDCPVIHVAGTNGKGSVSCMLAGILSAAGYKVGLFTSPHIIKYTERIKICGEDIPESAFADLIFEISSLSKKHDIYLTEFEMLTVLAFKWFSRSGCDICVVETGLGGRLDATNICRSELSVITRIGLDHCDWLGETVEKIAAEKAGIIKPGVPVVLGRNVESVCEVVRTRASELGAPFYFAPDIVSESELPKDLSLAGSFNRENALTALAALKVMAAKAPALNLDLALKGFAKVIWPGRFQRVGRFLVDGAHNPPAARALAEALEPNLKYELIAGFCGDKDVAETLRLLAPHVSRAFAVRTNNPRSLSAEETALKMQSAGLAAEPAPSLTEALRSSSGPTLVCGSLFLAGEALVELGVYPWGPTRFDPSERLREIM